MLKKVWMTLFLGAGLLLGGSSSTQANPVPNLSFTQRQQLARDLTAGTREDFFKQGREQFDREIDWLERRQLLQNPVVLKVEPMTPIRELEHWQPPRSQFPLSPELLPSSRSRLP